MPSSLHKLTPLECPKALEAARLAAQRVEREKQALRAEQEKEGVLRRRVCASYSCWVGRWRARSAVQRSCQRLLVQLLLVRTR